MRYNLPVSLRNGHQTEDLAKPEKSGGAKLQGPTGQPAAMFDEWANSAAIFFTSESLAKPEQSGDAKLQDPTGVASCDVRLSANGAAFLFPRQRNPYYVAHPEGFA